MEGQPMVNPPNWGHCDHECVIVVITAYMQHDSVLIVVEDNEVIVFFKLTRGSKIHTACN
jgi:hypothetical protein